MDTNLTVDSSPSKEFFIDMITKDVTVESCILDLIDNSIDAHKKGKIGIKSEISINFSLDKDYFQIADNCGGMSKAIAQTKAFRFGNTETRFANSLGMYGIGMKRSIFKIGENFYVESKTNTEAFKVYMDREEWLKLSEWKFHLDDCQISTEPGVNIHISKLSDSLKAYLKWGKNLANLKTKIATSYKDLINDEVTIRVNGERVIYTEESLFESDIVHSYVRSIKLPDVSIKIIAGISTASPKEAGWNIICNGRTVIDKDKTELTGWESNYTLDEYGNVDGMLNESSKSIPAFHNDFARFRGYVYIEAEDANELPLNTTKDSIDRQHPVYELIYTEMVDVMKKMLPQIRKLQEIARECKNAGTIPPTESLSAISVESLFQETKRGFSMQLDSYKPVAKMKSITMYIDERDVAKWKQYFEATTNKELGEKMYKFILDRVDLNEQF